jgi:hypothetical protein
MVLIAAIFQALVLPTYLKIREANSIGGFSNLGGSTTLPDKTPIDIHALIISARF